MLTDQANLDAAAAAVRQAEIALDQVNIRAPFAGVFDMREVEVGAYLAPGGACGTVIELDPLKVIGDVPETQIAKVRVGAPAHVVLASGQRLDGVIYYVAHDADAQTRTYPVVVAAHNPGSAVRSGLSAQVAVEAGQGPAYLAPSLRPGAGRRRPPGRALRRLRRPRRLRPGDRDRRDAPGPVADRIVGAHPCHRRRPVLCIGRPGRPGGGPGEEAGMIDALIDGAIKRRKVVLAITALAILFGLSAYLTLPRESDPNINYGYVFVQVVYPGVSPEDSERLLVRPLEVELQSLEGLKEMNGQAVENAALMLLQFEPGADRDRVLNDVRAKVDLARGRFPPDALPPVIQEITAATDNPVITVLMFGTAPERALYQQAQALQRRLEGLPGVLGADLSGGREEVMEITIDPVRMQANGVTPGELAGLVARNNQLVPAGDIQTKQGLFSVKVPGVVQKPEDILSLAVKTSGDRVVTLGDIGDVRRTFKDSQRITRYNGQTAFAIDVTKRPGANILDTVKLIKTTVAEEQKTWPPTMQTAFSFDQSDQIARMLILLESGLITASILVMAVVIASLGVRSGLMVGAAIPRLLHADLPDAAGGGHDP